MRAIKIGEIGIDSGHLLIIDPGMARVVAGRVIQPPHGVIAKELDFPSGINAIAGHGDGDYPVYALYDKAGDYVGLTICFFDDVDYPFDITEGDLKVNIGKEGLTKREIQDWLAKIQRMEHFEMAVLMRFAPAGHPCFNNEYPQLFGAFSARFNRRFKGMGTAISKKIGRDPKVWAGKYGLPEKKPE